MFNSSVNTVNGWPSGLVKLNSLKLLQVVCICQLWFFKICV